MGELLVDQLRTMARRFPDEVAYRNLDAGTAVTFRQWEQESNRLARGLVRAGVDRGDRVAILLPSEEVLHWIVAYAAVHKAGAVCVPTNTRLTPRELDAVLGHAEVKAVITTAELAAGLPAVEVLVEVPWDPFLAEDASEFQVPVDDHDLADIMYTSGTTGLPKGVAVRHDNLSLIPNGVPEWTGRGWLTSSPLFTFAGIGFIYNPMKMGLVGLFQPSFDAGRWIEHVERHRPPFAFIVPAMAALIINHPRFEEADLSSLELLSIGSAPLPPEVLRRLQDRLPGTTVANGYGMTEAGPAYCVMPQGESRTRIGSVGLPLPPAEIRIADDAGNELPPGEHGEVLIRIPGKQREYYRDPEATARTWAGGWLHSGDIGYRDADGYLYIVGRSKDVIIRGGNNIHATDVESVLYEHPAVLEAAVVGVPHDVLGEDVAAYVVVKPGSGTSPEELEAFCRERLAGYKVPRRITLLDRLPRNATGKVVKRELLAPPPAFRQNPAP